MFLLQIKTVKVSNVSLGASLQDIHEFFSFSGDIEYVEMKRLMWYIILLLHFLYVVKVLNLSFETIAVTTRGLRLHMSHSRIHKGQKLLFFFQYITSHSSADDFNQLAYTFSLYIVLVQVQISQYGLAGISWLIVHLYIPLQSLYSVACLSLFEPSCYRLGKTNWWYL